jgi:hypothetical protein
MLTGMITPGDNWTSVMLVVGRWGGGAVGVTHLFASKTMGGCSGPMKGYGKGSRWSHPTLTPAQPMPS